MAAARLSLEWDIGTVRQGVVLVSHAVQLELLRLVGTQEAGKVHADGAGTADSEIGGLNEVLAGHAPSHLATLHAQIRSIVERQDDPLLGLDGDAILGGLDRDGLLARDLHAVVLGLMDQLSFAGNDANVASTSELPDVLASGVQDGLVSVVLLVVAGHGVDVQPGVLGKVLGRHTGNPSGPAEGQHGLASLRLAMGVGFVAGFVAKRFSGFAQCLLRRSLALAGVAFGGGLGQVFRDRQRLLEASYEFITTEQAADGLRAAIGRDEQALLSAHRPPAARCSG